MSSYVKQVAENWKALILTTTLLIGLPLAIVVGYYVDQSLRARDIALEPQSVMLTPPGSDPRNLGVSVIAPRDGWCLGQLRPQATETTTQVRLGDVIVREYPHGPCAMSGGEGKLAWADLTLKAPLGHRSVVRSSNGATLPILEANAPP